MKPELVLDARADLAEGPVWDQRRERLLWVDMTGQTVSEFYPATGQARSVDMPSTTGFIVLREDAGLVVGLRDGLWSLDDELRELEPLVPLDYGGRSLTLNDGACDAAGRLWAGTTADDLAPGAGALWRIDADLRPRRMVDAVTISNGVGWSPDGTLMYYVDSPTHSVDVLDFDAQEGTIRNRRRFADVPDGLPDGLAVDAEGCVWVAVWDGWEARRFTPDGVLDRAVRLPARRVTNCAFGGPDLDELFITTARIGLTPGELVDQPLAGGIFVVRPGVRGLAPDRFVA